VTLFQSEIGHFALFFRRTQLDVDQFEFLLSSSCSNQGKKIGKIVFDSG
jgi:hypothetical protein